MLKFNCLIKDTSAIEDIKAIIQLMVAENIEDGKPSLFPSIYYKLRQEGIEIDAESAGKIYNEAFGSYSDKWISTPTEVAEFTGKEIDELVKDIADEIVGEEKETEVQTIGKLSPEKAIATSLAKLFQRAEESTVGKESSDLKKMQDVIAKAARASTPAGQRKNTTSFLDAVNNFFEAEAIQFKTLQGGLNTLRTLFNQSKKELDVLKESITSKLDDEQAELFEEKWDNYMQSFMDSAYDIMLGRGEQNKLLNNTLKRIKIDGIDLVDVNGNTKWGVLLGSGNQTEVSPQEVGDAVAKLFRDGVTDESGNEVQYPNDQARRIGDYVQKLYSEKLNAKKAQKIGLNRASQTSSKNLISDFIKDLGFFNLVKDKNGKLLLTQADWKGALDAMKKADGEGLELPIEKLKEFLRHKKNEDGSRRFSDEQINIVVNEFHRVVQAKLMPGTNDPKAIDRLIGLYNANGGNAFNESTQYALNKLAGVSNISQETIDKIKKMANAAQQIVNAGNLVGSNTTPNQLTNSGTYAHQLLAQIDRKIREILREHRIGASIGSFFGKSIADVLTTAANSKLINPGNIGENIFTAIGTSPAESLALIMTNPELRPFLKDAQGSFWDSFLSHAGGGVASDIVNSEDIQSDIQAGERLRMSKFVKGVTSGEVKQTASTLLQSPQYAVSVFTRAAMNSFDSGFNKNILSKSAVQSMYEALADLSSKEKAIEEMNKVLNITPETISEIDRIANEMKKVMNDAGIYPTQADMALTKREMTIALYEQAFMNVNPNISAKQAHEIVKGIQQGASDKTKVLTGKKYATTKGIGYFNPLFSIPNFIGQFLTKPQQIAYGAASKLEQEGKLNAAARMQLTGAVLQTTLGLFLGGAAKFAALASTATPLGFLNALDFKRQAAELKSKGANDVSTAEPGEIRKYAEAYGLYRSTMIRAALGTAAMTLYLLSIMFEDDDDREDNVVANLMKTKSGRRLLQKFGPIAFNVVANAMYQSYDTKGKEISKSRALMEYVQNVATLNGGQPSFSDKVKRTKTDSQFLDLVTEEFSNMLPSYNINQLEQMERFGTTLKSASGEREDIRNVFRQEKIASDIYKEADGFMGWWLRNSATDVIRRAASKDEKVNRFEMAE